MADEGSASPEPDPPERSPVSLARSSAVKVAADIGTLGSGTIVSIVTARELGPSGKGTLSALLFMSALLIQTSSLGMGDASVVWIAQGRVSVQRALSCGLTVCMGASLAAVLALAGYGLLQLPLEEPYVAPALAAAAIGLGISGAAQMLLFIVYGTGGALALSAVTLMMSFVTAISVALFVAVLDLSLLGATLGTLAGGGASLAAGIALVWRRNLRLRLGYDQTYVASAVRYGLKSQLANIFAVSSARVDLLIVYAIAGSAAAGQYSVALTIGTLASTAAIAISYASFGGLAGASESAAIDLLLRTARIALLLSLSGALLGAVLVPFAVPLAFGQGFSGAVGPSAILLLANVLWSGQWILSRGIAARGDTSLALSSFAANLTVMVIGDVLLVPGFGATGGAIAFLVASAVGFSMCVSRIGRLGVSVRRLLPRPIDAMTVAALPRRLFDSIASRPRRSPS